MKRHGHHGKFPVIVLFVGIFAFWWGVSVLIQNGTVNSIIHPSADTSMPSAYMPKSITKPVLLQESHIGDTYRYSGSLAISSTCDELGTGIAVQGQNPEHITILFTFRKPLTDCAEAAGDIVEQPFTVSLSVKPGTKAILDGITVNGIIVAAKIEATTKK